ncbi:MAG: mycofactocin radical SAM maturase [Chloroflexi bacterium RBG_16_50_11]|nr:MAG: mycofactocin radical SAM maturase [Chloroflexi bacterium RBG_16_50_11]
MKYADWPLSAPVNITWEITHRCNLRCVHCLSGSSVASESELNFNECRGIVDQLAELKVFEINFGGGEPLLKDYFLPLLRYIHQKGIVTCISTNGTVLTDEAIACFTDNPLVNVQVSLDGATPEVNDAIRGRGTFRCIIGGIERLAGKNIPLSINTVVTSLNYMQLKQLKELAAAYGANLRVSRFRPSGRARASWEALRLNSLQLRELADWLNSEPGVLTGDSFFSISQDGRRQLGLDMCGACKMTACIDPIGNVYPCAFMQDTPFCGGNLREKMTRHSRPHAALRVNSSGNPGEGFKDIWENAAAFKYFRQLEPEACHSCSRFDKCRGGCPSVAYFVSQDLNSADPECLVNWSREVSACSPPLSF